MNVPSRDPIAEALARNPPAADVGRRFLAGLIDLLVLGALGLVCSLAPLAYGGAALPMIGSLVAITAYAIVPASVFGATPGMAIAGTRIISANGGAADGTEIAFRELVGRGLIGAAYLSTAAIGLAGYLSGYLQFFVPRGLGLFLFSVSGLLLLFSAASHLAILLRPDGRALHDLFTRTMIVRRTVEPDPQDDADEEAAAFTSARRRRKVRGFITAELLLMAIAFGLPLVVGNTSVEGPQDLEDRIALKKAERRFEKDPTDPEAAAELAAIHRRSGDVEEAVAIETEHRAAMAAAGIEPSDRDYLVKKYRALLKTSPCALGSAVALGERLNNLGDYDGALELVAQLEKECGPRPRLWWITLTAHREKGELDLAIADSTRLIESRPADSDFWWWRGEDHAKKGDRIRAEADFRQSMAVYADGFAAKRFADLMREGDRCEGIFALLHLLEENPEAAGSWAEASLAELQVGYSGPGRAKPAHPSSFASPTARSGLPCNANAARGKATLKIAPDTSVRAKAAINGRKGRFLVHPTGYVTVTEAFAKEAGLTPGETTVDVRIAERVVPARLAVADRIAVGGTKADLVPIAIVSELPGEVDGLLGLSYLWRFRITRTEKALELSAR